VNRRLAFSIGLAVTLLLAFGVSRWASSHPDGLEKVAADEGFLDTADEHAFADAAFADYGTEGIEDDGLGTGVAGVVGVAITFVAAAGLVVVARRLPRRSPPVT